MLDFFPADVGRDPYGYRYDDEYNEYYDEEYEYDKRRRKTGDRRRRKHGCTWSSVPVYHLVRGKGEIGVGRKLQRRKEGDYIDEWQKIELEERL